MLRGRFKGPTPETEVPAMHYVQSQVEHITEDKIKYGQHSSATRLAEDWLELKTELDSARAQLASANEALIGKHKRDMFAAAALTACIPMLDQSDAYIATRAFEFAEAMLVESAKRAQQP